MNEVDLEAAPAAPLAEILRPKTLDAGQLWQKEGMVMAGAYVMASVLSSLLAFGAGFWAVKHIGIWQ